MRVLFQPADSRSGSGYSEPTWQLRRQGPSLDTHTHKSLTHTLRLGQADSSHALLWDVEGNRGAWRKPIQTALNGITRLQFGGPAPSLGGGPERLLPGAGCVSIPFGWIAEWYPSAEMPHCLSAPLPRTCAWLLIQAIGSRRRSGSCTGVVWMHVAISPGEPRRSPGSSETLWRKGDCVCRPWFIALQPGPPNPGVRTTWLESQCWPLLQSP